MVVGEVISEKHQISSVILNGRNFKKERKKEGKRRKEKRKEKKGMGRGKRKKGWGEEKEKGDGGKGKPHPKVTSFFFSQGTLQVLVYLSKPQM